MGKLTMRNLKFHEDMSEETPCFSADLYEEGKLIAHVKNDGRGGCCDVHPAKGLKYDDVKHLTDIDTDCEIMQMAEELNLTKKKQAKAFVLKKGTETYLCKVKQPFTVLKKYGNYDVWLKNELEQFKKQGYEVLNTNL